MKTTTLPLKHSMNRTPCRFALLIPFALACFALSPKVQAVSPPPDGGYPGGNTAEGQSALSSLTTGTFNSAVGFLSLQTDTTGSFNTAVGAAALFVNNGDENAATGVGALLSNTTGSANTAAGDEALFSNVIGGANTANGVNALLSNTVGNNNTANGASALFHNISGNFNTADGDDALVDNTVGNNNTAAGLDALDSNISGNNNVALGFLAGANVTTANNVICIGTSVAGANVDDTCFIGNIFGATSSGGIGVFVNENGQLGTQTSSKRFKDNIKPMDRASESILALQPVTFHYKKEVDPRSVPQFGLVAEEVEKVNPDLVVRDRQGRPYSVRYDQVNAMLLNEFLKEHQTVQELKKQVAELTAGLQKVTAELELSKLAPRTVLNNH